MSEPLQAVLQLDTSIDRARSLLESNRVERQTCFEEIQRTSRFRLMGDVNAVLLEKRHKHLEQRARYLRITLLSLLNSKLDKTKTNYR
jgi:hypothetical protein